MWHGGRSRTTARISGALAVLIMRPLEKQNVSPPRSKTPRRRRSAVVFMLSLMYIDQLESSCRYQHCDDGKQQDLP